MSDRCKILVADDQPGVLRLLQEILEEDGYDVITARDGRQILELISREPPGLILMDLKMPGMDGKQVLEELKKTDRKIPVIVMTAYDKNEIVEDINLEIKYYLRKPFDLEEIRSVIKGFTGTAGGLSSKGEDS
ncbi:MAG: response regulator [Clostridiales bacterium]|nr:response regulator [Clostridiales bacterium]MCF8022530.1 response regulator [Clostridiales bacterium]